MKFDIITIFPEIFKSYFSESIIKRAQQKKLIKIKIHNLRDYTDDKHKSVDDKPYGGGPGMVMKIEPIYKAVQFSKSKIKDKKQKIILFSPKGKKFDQKMAKRFAKLDRLILICGRYEGVDERVAKYIADEEISIGDYVLTGGEIPAMLVVDAVTRLIPGVIALESLKEESFNIQNTKYPPTGEAGPPTGEAGKIQDTNYEYPQYTRPEEFLPAGRQGRGWKVPRVLLSGNHEEINKWRKTNK